MKHIIGDKIKNRLKKLREDYNFTEEHVQLELDRFEFSNILLPADEPSINLTWNTDSYVFKELCNKLMILVSFGSDATSRYYKNELLWRQIMFAVHTIDDELSDLYEKFTTSFGENWYLFSVIYPRFLATIAFSYAETFNVENDVVTQYLLSYTANFYEIKSHSH